MSGHTTHTTSEPSARALRHDATGEVSTWRRVLVVRSCRMPQFRAAVALAVATHPGVRIWALTNEAFERDVREAGAHDVIVHQAKRLGPFAVGAACLRALRSIGLDAVVVPIMDDTLSGAANLLRLAAAIGAPHTAISPHGTAWHQLDRRRVRHVAIAHTLGRPESVTVLGQMLRAFATRRERPHQRTGRMRVLHIINSLGLGGAQTQCAALIERTPPDQFDVSVLVLADEGVVAHGDRIARGDVTVTVLRRRLDGGTPIDAIVEHCRRGGYDVVHTWLPLANMYGSAGARLARVPRIVTSIRSLNPGRYPQWCQWWYRPADVLAARLADVVTVNATPLARDHGRWALRSPRRIAVVHNGLEPAAPDPSAATWLRHLLGVPIGRPILGNVGRLAVEKDQSTFLHALAVLAEQGRSFHAVLVGDGPTEQALRALTVDLGVASQVTFMGRRSDARRIMAGLDLLVLTSIIEGFPNVLLEAAMLGVPLVSANVGGVGDLVDEPAALFPPADPEAAAAAIAATLDDRAATTARTDRLRERSHTTFSADRMAQRWLSLYRDDLRHTAGTERVRGAALALERRADV